MRILTIGGLTEKGMQFIKSLSKQDWLVIIDDFEKQESARNLMELLISRKFRFYRGNIKDKKRIEEIKKIERIEKIYDFSA